MKQKMKLFVRRATAIALGIVAVSPAVAATYSVGAVGTTPYVNFASIAGGATSFADTYDFQILPGLEVGALSIQNHPLAINSPFSLSVLDIGGLSMSIYDSANVLVAGSVASFSGVLAPGNYSASVSGLTSGTSGGAYSFAAASYAVAAVPEADTWALMLAGLGVVGAAVRRRATRA